MCRGAAGSGVGLVIGFAGGSARRRADPPQRRFAAAIVTRLACDGGATAEQAGLAPRPRALATRFTGTQQRVRYR